MVRVSEIAQVEVGDFNVTLWPDGGAKRMSTGVACAIRGAEKKLIDSMVNDVAPIVSIASGMTTSR